jgi:putative transposase
MKTGGKSKRTIVSTCHSHLVFCPKYRRNVLVDDVAPRLKQLLAELVERWGQTLQTLVELEVLADHVHLLVGGDPQVGIHRLVNSLKGATAHHLRQASFPHQHRRTCRSAGPTPPLAARLGA